MKYLEGFLATHKVLQLYKLMVKTSGIDITLNELIIIATIGRDKKEVREISKANIIDKATVVRTLGQLKDRKMVSKLKIGSKVYYILTSSTIKLLDDIQKDNLDALNKMNIDEREELLSTIEGVKKSSNILTDYLIED